MSAWSGAAPGAEAPDIWLSSQNDGQSWNTLAKLVNGNYSGVSTGTGDSVLLCCSVGSDSASVSGVVSSTDSGRTWQQRPAQFWVGTATFQGASIWAGDLTGAIYKLNSTSNAWEQRKGAINIPLSTSANASQHLWFAGTQGTVIHSPNAGASWEQQSTGSSLDIVGIYAADASHVWAYSSSYAVGGNVFYSADSGRTWTTSNISAASGQITSLVTLGPTSALVSGIQLQGPNQVEGLFLTNDGGRTWTFRSAASLLNVPPPDGPRRHRSPGPARNIAASHHRSRRSGARPTNVYLERSGADLEPGKLGTPRPAAGHVVC